MGMEEMTAMVVGRNKRKEEGMKGIQTANSRTGNRLTDKAADNLLNCFRMVLLMTIAMKLFLKANAAEVSILFMDLDDTLNSAKACTCHYTAVANPENSEAERIEAAEILDNPIYQQVTSRTQTALHGLIDNVEIASGDLPMFVVTAGLLLKATHQDDVEVRKAFVAETFGVSVDAIDLVPDIAAGLGVNDPYNNNGSWPIRGYMIKKGTPWGEQLAESTGTNKTSRHIFLTSTLDVFGDTKRKYCLLVRLIDLALRQEAVKGAVAIHTIGPFSKDMVFRSERGDITYIGPKDKYFGLNVVNIWLNFYSMKSYENMEQKRATAQKWERVEEKELRRIKDTIMKPLEFTWNKKKKSGLTASDRKTLLARCLSKVPELMEDDPYTVRDITIRECVVI
eukprot:GHVS01108622.1.p1 GENE.GHVS01108622.1~~GHVS01108622.1.p1  ORF type:complete len:395 (+),score=42.31 GHVS01108622.1:385-1569(+)